MKLEVCKGESNMFRNVRELTFVLMELQFSVGTRCEFLISATDALLIIVNDDKNHINNSS